jgi:hypothetical protein
LIVKRDGRATSPINESLLWSSNKQRPEPLTLTLISVRLVVR